VVSSDQHSSIDRSNVVAEPAVHGALLRLMDVLVDIARNDHRAASTPGRAQERSICTDSNPCRTTSPEGDPHSHEPTSHARQCR
jgi:hypothetical protein